MADIVPFGKYKNQPLAALAQDRGYCDWLLTQGWVAERYPELRTIIINNFGEPSETPEHNALQLRFLEEDLRLKVSRLALLASNPQESQHHPAFLMKSCTVPQFEVQSIDVSWIVKYWEPVQLSEGGGRNPTYEWFSPGLRIGVECKPSLGDDYPAVLRFMHSLKNVSIRVVLAESFTFQGGTIAQVQALFQSSGILLLHMQGIDALPPVHLVAENELPAASEYWS